jgi:SH3 domain protein
VRKLSVLAFGLCSTLAQAAPVEGKTQYIADDVAVTMREAPRSDSTIRAQLRSGMKITVLQSLGPESFAQVRLDDGREGWIPARMIQSEPAAKDRLAPVQAELRQSRERVATLERELATAREAVAKAAPALQLAEDNEKLQALMAEKERAVEELKRQYSEEESRRKTLMVGAGLVGGGVVLGLVLPWFGRSRRRGGF